MRERTKLLLQSCSTPPESRIGLSLTTLKSPLNSDMLSVTHLRGEDQVFQARTSSFSHCSHHTTFYLLKSPVLYGQLLHLGCSSHCRIKALILLLLLSFDSLPVDCHGGPEFRVPRQLQEPMTGRTKGKQRPWTQLMHDVQPHLQI